MALFSIPWLSESIKKRALRYLLQRYLGNFLLEKLSLDQLSLDLYEGKGSIRDIVLDVDTINEEVNQLIPFKFIDGSIDELNVFVPWSSLLTDSSSIHFNGISFNLCKLLNKKNNDFRESTVISKSLMTSSMQIAEEIVNEEQEKFDGLEMFAQLIDSVLRRFKLSASNTSFKMVVPHKTGDGQQIEIKIKYFKCEEEEQIGDNDNNDQNLSIVSETITKIISLEGIEIFINEVLICKLNGRHSIRLKIDENITDLQIYLGSHIFAFINSKHLQTLIEFFECGEQLPQEIPLSGEKMMSPEDYLRVEQQLQIDSGCGKTANTVISSSSVTIDSNKWTTCGLIEDEPKFLPLRKILEDKEMSNSKEKLAKKSQFLCHIKIPGLMLCLISSDSMPVFNGMPIVDNHNSFSRINSSLDQILEGYNHLRFLALHLLFDVNSESFSLTCGDLMVNEVLDNKMSPILWNQFNDQLIVSPLLKLKIIDKKVLLNICSICAKLDPTFLERIHKYFDFNSRKNSNQTNSDFNIEVNCDDIKVELMFPIPDLRPFKDRNASQLRDETLLLKLRNTSINYNSFGGEIKCKSLELDFQMSNTYTNLLNAHSIDSKLICLKFRIGIKPTINTTLTEEVKNLYDAEMEDSIYIGQSVPQLVTEPFQVKRKVIGRTGDENEQVITPGDRLHINKYLETSETVSQIFIELFVPTIDIHFQNKEQFELLYNRIGNDLILWTPLPNDLMDNNIGKESISQNPTFFTCKAPQMFDSFGSTNSSFHSFVGWDQNSRINLMTCIFDINDITFEMRSKEENIQSIFSQNLLVGIVVGAHDQNNSTICLCGENLSLKSDGNLIISGNVYSEPNCALNLAVDINRESDSLKKIKLSLQLSCAAMYDIRIDVFEQFWNFINVIDEIVIGYIPPKVITELHIDLVDSAITLENLTERPALITFEDIYLTSMVVENTNQTLLRIFAEETLFCFKRNKTALEAMKNYICVVQSGIIDLNLKLGKDGKLEFKLSNNAIDIRVCSDSFCALCQLICSLTSTSSSNIETECNSSENISFQDSLDGNLIADAMKNNEETRDSIDSDEEPPKFCNCESPKLDESGFWILGDDDLGTGIKMTSEPQIRVLTTEPVKIIENHFNISRYRIIPEISPSTISRYLLEEMTLILHLFDGKDFDDDVSNETQYEKRTEDNKSHKSFKSFAASEPKVRFAEGSVHIWENIDLVSSPISLRGSNSSQSIGASNSFKCSGGSKRINETCVQLYLAKVKTLFETFDTDYPLSWRFLFMVQDIEIIDRVIASKIKKMLYEYCSESIPRRKHANMISIKATAFRKSTENSEESDLKISVKPLRVNIDQDTLLFLGEFFSTVIAMLDSNESENTLNTTANNQINNNFQVYDEVIHFDDTLSNNSEVTQDSRTTNSSNSTVRNVTNYSSNSNKVYFKSFTFSPDVPIRLDYHGKHVDFDRGALRGLFLGLGQLNQSELHLKRLVNKHGILGFDKVLSFAINEWTKDIKRNQLPSLLGGVGPMHSFIQLFQGIRDLIWMPIDQYRRDRRLVRGLQRGASSFSASTAMATLDLANRFVTLIQSAAQFAHDVVTPPTPGHRQQCIQTMNAQPRDLREGVAAAYAVMREGLHDTVRGVTNAGMGADDVSGAIGEVVRQIPSTLVRPLIHASQATSNVLVGMRNQLTPEARKDDHEKWKNATDR